VRRFTVPPIDRDAVIMSEELPESLSLDFSFARSAAHDVLPMS
jgi:hypothetical protein